METGGAVAWTAPLVVGLAVWNVSSFPVGMAAMLVASALVWLVYERPTRE